MMNMMYSTGLGSGLFLFWGLHVFSVLVFGIGLLFLFFWAFKHLSVRDLWKWGWIFVVVGTVGCLVALAALPFRFGRSSDGWMMGHRGIPMMWSGDDVQTGDSEVQIKEEADGKSLYEKLQAKEVKCAALSDSDFELIGEYFMGQKLGAGHEQMNAMMQQMMGQEGEEQMHIILGKNQTGCATGTQSSGGMMRRFSSGTAR